MLFYTLNESIILYTNQLDHYNRFISHDFIVNTFYYFWTNFWFLLPFVLVKIIFISGLQILKFNIKYILYCLFIILYSTIVFHYWCFNFTGLLDVFYYEAKNILLTNSINKYHPMIFYLTLNSLTIKYFNYTFSNYKQCQSQKYKFVSLQTYYVFYLLNITITLILGGWWALQEGSWGGWWNWDPSEVFGLLIMLICIYNVHSNYSYKSHNTVFKSTHIQILIVVLVYLFIQLNFDLVSHNFGTRIHQFLNSYYSYLVGLTVINVLVYFNFIQIVLKTFNKISLKTQNTNTILTLLLWATVFLLFASFIELLVNFTWLLFNTNNFNFTTNLSRVVFLILTLVIILFYNLSIFNLITLLVFSYIFGPIKFILVSCIYFYHVNFQHKLIYFWVINTLLYNNQTISEWIYTSSNILNYTILNLTTQNYTTLKLNSIYIETISSFLVNNRFIDYVWGFIFNTSTSGSQCFSHNYGSHKLYQTLKSFYLEFEHLITVIDYNTTLLPWVILLWFIVSWKKLINKNTIIF